MNPKSIIIPKMGELGLGDLAYTIASSRRTIPSIIINITTKSIR
jgi:hypothetical protein